MALPYCKLISLAAPASAPENVALAIVIQSPGGLEERITAKKLSLQNGEYFFDDDDLLPFRDDVQLKLGLNALGGSHQDLGAVIVSATDLNKVLTQRFSQIEPIYELTYKAL